MSQMQTSPAHQETRIQPQRIKSASAQNDPTAGHLTLRGRRVVAILALLPMIGALTLLGVHKAEAVGTAPTTRLIAVQPGDSMWDIAVRIAPNQDPRKTMWDIAQLNHMSTSDLHSGQPLIVPNP